MGKLGKVLGSISPLYGIASGEGFFGKTSPLSLAIHSGNDDKEKRKPGPGMKRGGSVSKRADGIAKTGKTKGRFV